MPSSTANSGESPEIIFDIAKPKDGVDFLGLQGCPGSSTDEMVALFNWRCAECGASNSDTVTVKPQQAFLSRWVCNQCGKAKLARFLARPATEWIVQHNLAITGAAFRHRTQEGVSVVDPFTKGWFPRRASQRLFAGVAIPALVLLIGLALSGGGRLSGLSAFPSRNSQTSSPEAVLRLLGYWQSEAGDSTLYFDWADVVSGQFEYTYFSASDREGRRFRSDIVYLDPKGEQLIIGQSPRVPDRASGQNRSMTSEAIIHVTAQAESLTWIDLGEGKPTVKVYRRVDGPSVR